VAGLSPAGAAARLREHAALLNLATIRRWLGIAGIALLGGALALAPILAFTGDMTLVSGAGIAGIAFLIVMRLLPRPPPEGEPPDAGPPGPDAPR
jgi:hypothetical protein